jgi:hypothetical protein
MTNDFSGDFGYAAFFALLLSLPLSAASAEPLVTITCDQPKGFNITYGTSLRERFEAREKKLPFPTPTFSGPNNDGFLSKPTFVIDANKRDVTVIWTELPEDVELRKQAKKLNIPQPPPPPASNATVVWFMPDLISAIDAEPWSIVTYSFFPKLGTAFIGQQSMSPGSKDTTEIATFAHCELSWTNPKDAPAQ